MENWKILNGSNDLYEVSNDGRVRRIEGRICNSKSGGTRKVGGNVLSQKTKSNGYKEVTIYIAPQVGKTIYVHRAVAEAFICYIQKGLEVNHIDGDKANNCVSNLEVVSPSDNRIHAYYELGKKIKAYKGESHGMAKLSEQDVLKIRSEYAGGITIKDLGITFKTPYSTVCKIVYRKTWKHI